MNSSDATSPGWSWRRWGIMIGLVLTTQLALVFVLGERVGPAPNRSAPTISFRLIPDPDLQRQLARLPVAADPTVFALAHPDGFSGAVWLKAPSVEHHPGEWTEPPAWLSNRAERLGDSFAGYVRSNAVDLVSVADKLPPTPVSPAVAVGDEPRPSKSVLRTEGALRQRAVAAVPELPSWPYGDVLNSTVVQVMVDAKGFVSSPNLTGTSGLKEADQKALELAKQVRFQPLAGSSVQAAGPRGDLAWGRIVFDWHTLPPATTNAPPAGRTP